MNLWIDELHYWHIDLTPMKTLTDQLIIHINLVELDKPIKDGQSPIAKVIDSVIYDAEYFLTIMQKRDNIEFTNVVLKQLNEVAINHGLTIKPSNQMPGYMKKDRKKINTKARKLK
jgi:aconitase B